MLVCLSFCSTAAIICGEVQGGQRVSFKHPWVQVGEYAESLKANIDAEDEPSVFSDGGDTAELKMRHLDPEQLRNSETGKLLLPLGGLGTDR